MEETIFTGTGFSGGGGKSLTKTLLPDNQTYRVIGIDAGSNVFGLSEFELRYKWNGESFLTLAKLLDFYSFKVHAGAGWTFDRRLLYVHDYFKGSFPTASKLGTPAVAYIEDVPFARSARTHAELNQIIGAIKLPLLAGGWAVNMVNNMTWKKEVIGNGRARKPEIREWATGGNIPADPHELNEDNLDALCIGYYGITRMANQLRYDITSQRAIQRLMFE